MLWPSFESPRAALHFFTSSAQFQSSESTHFACTSKYDTLTRRYSRKLASDLEEAGSA
jgi:hypothetical protein